jgi:hypothetical protein
MATAPTIESLSGEIERLKRVVDELSGGTTKFGNSLGIAGTQVLDGAKGFAKGLADGAQGASAFNGVINAGSAAMTTMLSAAGPLGAAFSGLTKLAAEYVVRANAQGDALFKSFQELSQVGGASTEGMKGVFDNMQKFGLTMNQMPEFGAMITKNSEALAVMGGTVSQGAKAFANVAAGIQQSGLQTEFERMGLTTKNINEGTASYLRIQTLTGMNANKSTEALTAGAAEYIRQQDRLSRLTGKSADVLAKEAEARQSNERYAAVTLELQMKAAAARASGDEAGAQAAETQLKQNEETLNRLPASMKQGFQDLMTGMVTTPEAQKMFVSLPKAAQDVMSQQAKTGEEFENSMAALAAESKAAAERNVGLAKAGVNNQVGADFAGLIAAGKMPTGDAAKQAKQQQTVLGEGGNVDINNQVAMRAAQRATTQAIDTLVQTGVPAITSAMTTAATKIEAAMTIIPGTEKTSTSKTGRGENAPATAGYDTNTKVEDFGNFLNKTVDNSLKYLTEFDKPKPTDKQVFEGMTGYARPTDQKVFEGMRDASSRLAGPSSRPVTSNEQVFTGLTQAASGSNFNTGSSGSGSNPLSSLTDLPQSIMTLATNIGTQVTKTQELVDLMQASIRIQNQILRQSVN